MHKISLLLLRSFVFFVISLSNVYAEAEWDINTSKTISYANVSGHVTHGDVYNGSWRDGRRNGTGVLLRKDGTKFSGEFVDDNPAQ